MRDIYIQCLKSSAAQNRGSYRLPPDWTSAWPISSPALQKFSGLSLNRVLLYAGTTWTNPKSAGAAASKAAALQPCPGPTQKQRRPSPAGILRSPLTVTSQRHPFLRAEHQRSTEADSASKRLATNADSASNRRSSNAYSASGRLMAPGTSASQRATGLGFAPKP